jgi:hypothetical protein
MAGPGSRSYEADYDITRSVPLCAQENDNETLNYGGSGEGEMYSERGGCRLGDRMKCLGGISECPDVS